MVAAHPTSDRQCKNAGNKEVASSRVEVLTEMTNVVGSELLGVTLGSARCRDTNSIPSVKAITTGCRAYFAVTHDRDVPRCTPEEKAAWKPRRRRWSAK